LNAFGLADRNDLGVEFLRTLPASEFGRAIFLATDAFLWHLGVELKREPADLHQPIMRIDGLFQPPFADEAPRADHVGDDVNVQGHDRTSFARPDFV
jgi:hypothetical protein